MPHKRTSQPSFSNHLLSCSAPCSCERPSTPSQPISTQSPSMISKSPPSNEPPPTAPPAAQHTVRFDDVEVAAFERAGGDVVVDRDTEPLIRLDRAEVLP